MTPNLSLSNAFLSLFPSTLTATKTRGDYLIAPRSYPAVIVEISDIEDFWEGKDLLFSAKILIHCKTYLEDDPDANSLESLSDEVRKILLNTTPSLTSRLNSYLSDQSESGSGSSSSGSSVPEYFVHTAFLTSTFDSSPDNTRCRTFSVQVYFSNAGE